MNFKKIFNAARLAGLTVMVAAMAGCDRNGGSTATGQSGAATAQTGEYMTEATTSTVTPVAVGLMVTVSLAPAVARKAAADDVVFIFARAVQGPRMPLAIVRKQVKDLPVTVVLDDSQSMNPQMKLSSVPEVVVVARVSKSGMAAAQAGDLEGVSTPVKPGGNAVAISIARVLTAN